MFGIDGQENVPHREWLVAYNEELNRVKEALKADGREGKFNSKVPTTLHETVLSCSSSRTQVIYTTVRSITKEELEWYLEDCIALKKEFPHLIAGKCISLILRVSTDTPCSGFDLVGHEDLLHPLIYYLEPLLKFTKRTKEEGVDIPFIFHAGETLGDGTPTDDNLYDAILLGTKRIGHG